MAIFRDPEAAKGYIRTLFGEAILLWENAPPVRFIEKYDAWDFENTVQPSDNCNANGCTLARAFFRMQGGTTWQSSQRCSRCRGKNKSKPWRMKPATSLCLCRFFANIS